MIHRFFTLLLDHRYRWQWWFWLIVLLMAPLTSTLEGEDALVSTVVFRAVGMITKVGAAYFIAYFLLPELLFKKRYFLFLLALLPTIFCFTMLARTLNIHVAERILTPGVHLESIPQILAEWKLTTVYYFDRVFIYPLWFTFIKVGIDASRGQEQVARLREEKAAAELSLLKAQIHPHFLFNTLNNLYTLTVEKSDQAPEVVERLAGMLDYQLYQCNNARVRVQQEVELIGHYLKLESLRYGNRLRLSFDHTIDNPEAMVAPLILISPVENAFKHGASAHTGQPVIEVSLTVQLGILRLQVRNDKPPVAPTDNDQYTHGIGLANVTKQLELIYPDRHTISIRDTTTEYEVIICIDLGEAA